MDTQRISSNDFRYPPMLTHRLGVRAPAAVTAIGSLEILRHHRLGLICSVRCPGSIVIKMFDAIRQLRDASIVVAGGFHSPMEKEYLDFLLRGDVTPSSSPTPPLAAKPRPSRSRS